MASTLNLATAFLAGLVSSISPCVLPLVPSYLSFLTGTSLEELQGDDGITGKAHVIGHALFFIAGFTLIFVLLGLSASAIGRLFAADRELLTKIGGALIVVLGLNMLGIFRIPLLAMEKRFHVRHSSRQSFAISFLVGIAFAAGWSPCIGPILSAIFVLAANEHAAKAAFLLFVYSMGLALPFLLTAVAINKALHAFGRIKRFLGAIEATSGAIMVATGFVVFTDSFTRIAGFFYQFLPTLNL
ncbi:MAG TPA: cytochrome c biogenesis protein CcdA [Candidatus Baltobacteraceae bacterium]|jgi:cytochrome c-type biogenesis protein|nr:cytochrome c biogenesis protein CcdA [Candidatus Baltobacteraceae bacterium]